jgi:hypothetical protein
MTRTQYGWFATITGAAMAAAWWWRQRETGAGSMAQAGHERGEVVFSNSPQP